MRADEHYNTCVGALKAFVEQAGFTDVVLGLSGGMDSSVVAAMSVDAFGADRTHGVLLPGPYSSDHSLQDAQELADNLGIATRTVSISEPFAAFQEALARGGAGELAGLAAENTQARCRMVCLMALSNARGWMVVNTGNKSEAMMGYSTLYGDMAGAFAPIGGLYKTDVVEIARWRNGRARVEGAVPPIPESVFTKPPSAELSANQEDEKSMGITYDTLDKILIAHVEQGLNAEALVAAGFCQADVSRVLATMKATAFKRVLEPPAPEAAFYA